MILLSIENGRGLSLFFAVFMLECIPSVLAIISQTVTVIKMCNLGHEHRSSVECHDILLCSCMLMFVYKIPTGR
jgi:hypothetical protein